MQITNSACANEYCSILSVFFDTCLVAERTQYLKRADQIAVHDHDGPRIVKFAAIIRRTEDRQQLAVRLELVAVFYHLVGPANEVQTVACEKVRDNIVTESVGHTPA